MVQHAHDGLRLEEIRVVFGIDHQPVGSLGHPQCEVEIGSGDRSRHDLHRNIRQIHRRDGRILQDQHNLEQRRVAAIPTPLQALYHLLEGDVLVGIGTERYRSYAREQLAYGGIAQRSVRSARLFTKKPIRSAVSSRVRPAMKVPTVTSSWPE